MRIINWIKEDYDRRTILFASISIVIHLSFAIYNGVLGILYHLIWNGSICVYYLLLMGMKGVLVFGQFYCTRKNKSKYSFIYISYGILLLSTISMIVPAILLVQNKRFYDLGVIPAIAMAAYTTYSITMSIIHMNKTKQVDNLFVKQIRLINMVTAFMSILVLQNTMILANGAYTNVMKELSIISSIAIILSIIILIVYSLSKTIKRHKK